MSRLTLLAFLVTAPVGCTALGSEDRVSEVVVEDSAGVTIIDNGRIPPSEPGDTLVPSVEVGVLDGDVEYQFFRVSDAKRLEDGAIAVTNSGTRELRIYESDGTHRATAGGPGGGPPSEFDHPTTLTILPGDTIQVQDRLDRVYFTPAGEFIRREIGDRQALHDLVQAAGGFSEIGFRLADGTYVALIYESSSGAPTPGAPFRPPMTFARVSDDFSALDTIGRFGGALQQRRPESAGRRCGITHSGFRLRRASTFRLNAVRGIPNHGDSSACTERDRVTCRSAAGLTTSSAPTTEVSASLSSSSTAVPAAARGPHRHPYDEVQFIQQGRGLWNVEGEEFEAGAGDILVIKAGEIHSFRCIGEDPLVQLDVHLSPRFIQENLAT